MKARYIYRMDDVTPDMSWDKFWVLMNLFKKYKVKPLIGVVPENRDPELAIQPKNEEFWSIIRNLKDEGLVEIAQHGYQHLCVSQNSGLLGDKYGYVPPLSEFAGLSYEEQYEKVHNGLQILKDHGLGTNIFMAPWRTFDRVTLQVLKDLDFQYITDGIALFPYHCNGLTFIPQQLAKPRPMPCGFITIFLHANTIEEQVIQAIEGHLNSGAAVISFSEATQYREKIFYRFLNCVFKRLYYLLLDFKNIKGETPCQNSPL